MSNQVAHLSLPEIHRANNIIWMALLAGGTLMAGVLFFQSHSHPEFHDFDNFLGSIFMPIAVILTFSTAFFANLIIKKRYEASQQTEGLKAKFSDFRANFIVKAALHEGPMLISIIFMMLENNIFFLLLAAINWVLLYSTKPTIEKFKENYKLSSSEKQELASAGLV